MSRVIVLDFLDKGGASGRATIGQFVLRSKSFVACLILGGDRIACCDEAVIEEREGEVVGAASIAPHGEERSGQPTIVGVFVLKAYRGQGIGASLLASAINRCVEREFTRIRIDVLSRGMARTIAKLPQDLRALLDAHDPGIYYPEE